MPERWAVVDELVRDLGAVRIDVDVLDATTAPEAVALRQALDRAGAAVHHCIDDDGEIALHAARIALAQAKDQIQHARRLIDTTRLARERAVMVRGEAVRQRQGLRRFGRAPETPAPGHGSGEGD
jgi:hypothetical protein